MTQIVTIALAALAFASCGGGGGGGKTPVGPGNDSTPPAGATVARTWLTTADHAKTLSHEKDLWLVSSGPTAPITIDVDESKTYQTMIGFGAAFTDASTYLIQNKMSATQRETLLQDLFGRTAGIGLSFARVTMGASDFSLQQYSYDDVPPGQTDPTLAGFSIAPDRAYKLPVIQRALAINPQLTIMASPWSPPGWMKTTGSLIKGTLKPEAYAPFAEYFARFVEAYGAEGVPIKAVTLQNEPHYEPPDYPGMRLDDTARATLIRDRVGPLFASRGLSTVIWDWDHNWDEPNAPLAVLADAGARQYVQGVAWHCYAGDVSAQKTVHDAYPDKDVYFTECSGGGWDTVYANNLKWWVGTLVIGSTRNWARGVLFWNLALDEHDGPHTGGCGNCRGVVTINSVTGAVTRNVEYFALAHVSKFVRPGATRIESSSDLQGLTSVAFRNADDGSKALVVHNAAAAARTFALRWNGKSATYTLPAGSVVTFSWP
ncbi:MAG TPA: glycoside hydrolase family 30 beta sandwich domain-containing protein [Gemmatimonadaceae bacterium]|nr:glycoside hydrolase family 30 beta sandwich domain-containing protein [Gemmatimonadaceae bacterium]